MVAEVDAPVVAESRDGFARAGVECVEVVEDADEDAGLFPLRRLPKCQATVGLRADQAGIELPEEAAGGGVEREDFLRRRNPVEHSLYHDGAGLQAAFLSGVKLPSDCEAADVFAIDLSERGVVIVFES